MKNYLDRVRFLSVPESLRGRIEGEGDFSIDPSIPIPAEIPDGQETLVLEELSMEMITAGLLRVIQSRQMNQHLDYYRNFVLAVRPGILAEFTEAAILKAHNGDFDIALEILDVLLGLFPHSPVTLLNRALVLEERAGRLQQEKDAGEYVKEAAAAYERALELTPPFPDAFFNAGYFYIGQKNYSRALECFSQHLESAPDDEKAEQARALKKEIEDSGLDDENFKAACALIMQNREEEGLIYIREFIESRPAVWNGWFILGWALRKLKRWQDGAAAFQKAVELGGGTGDTRNELAICLMESGDTAAARHELETALRQDPENIKIISNLGVLALKDGNADEASAFFRTVLELDGTDPIALHYSEAER
jgi:tetratricopeptide (TPR) repeat protein